MKAENIVQFDRLWAEVQRAAEEAASKVEVRPWPCGFAWIVIPGRGNFAKYAKEYLGAHKNFGGPGFRIWYSRVYSARTQSMDVHEAACYAAAKVLNDNGIKCSVYSRMD